MQYPLPANRIVRGASSATLSFQFTDADGEAAAPSGSVTVAVTRSDGTAVSVGSVSGTTTDPRTVSVALAELADIDRLTAVWSDDGNEVATVDYDVVGGTVGSVAAIKAADTTLNGRNPDAIVAARKAAEDRFVSVTGRSPFLRPCVQRFDGTGCSTLQDAHFPDLSSVLWARIYSTPTSYTSLSAAQIAAIDTPDELSRFTRTDGGVWTYGVRNIEIAYVFGMTYLPQDLRDAFVHAVRVEATKFTSGVPDRSTTYASQDGIQFGIARPGNGRAYGIDEIDDVFMKYDDPRPEVA